MTLLQAVTKAGGFTKVAQEKKVQVIRVEKGEEVQRTFYAEVPIEIEFTGGYHNIADFFARIAQLPRIVNVSQLEMKIDEQGAERTVLRVEGEATTFRFLERGAAGAAPTGVPGPQGGRT